MTDRTHSYTDSPIPRAVRFRSRAPARPAALSPGADGTARPPPRVYELVEVSRVRVASSPRCGSRLAYGSPVPGRRTGRRTIGGAGRGPHARARAAGAWRWTEELPTLLPVHTKRKHTVVLNTRRLSLSRLSDRELQKAAGQRPSAIRALPAAATSRASAQVSDVLLVYTPRRQLR